MLQIKGELGERLWKNYARLMDEEYQEAHLFGSLHGWPGDWPGRAILALCRHARLSGSYPPFIDGIMDQLAVSLEDHGYLGTVSKNLIDEQSVSGHNWLLRGLLEHYSWCGEERSLQLAHRLVKERFLPLRGRYRDYPVDPEIRKRMGEASGALTGTSANGWELSTDIGCAFMSLDGLSAYFELTRMEEVGFLLEEMIEAFMKIDFVKASMQTHASLAAARGVLKTGQLRNHPEYITFAQDFFQLYCEKGMTSNYANFNWFGRPFWTEPCAIVDSLILAMELYLETGNDSYLEKYNRIFFNALCFAQRKNGGFGCDECAYPEEGKEYLQVMDQNYEAFWCCTMRGSDGLVYAAEKAIIRRKDHYEIPMMAGFSYEDENIALDFRTSFPQKGGIVLRADRIQQEQVLSLYLPQGVEIGPISEPGLTLQRVGQWIHLTLQDQGSWNLELKLEEREEKVGQFLQYYRGVLLQTAESVTGKRYSPYRKPLTLERSEVKDLRFRILWR